MLETLYQVDNDLRDKPDFSFDIGIYLTNDVIRDEQQESQALPYEFEEGDHAFDNINRFDWHSQSLEENWMAAFAPDQPQVIENQVGDQYDKLPQPPQPPAKDVKTVIVANNQTRKQRIRPKGMHYREETSIVRILFNQFKILLINLGEPYNFEDLFRSNKQLSQRSSLISFAIVLWHIEHMLDATSAWAIRTHIKRNYHQILKYGANKYKDKFNKRYAAFLEYADKLEKALNESDEGKRIAILYGKSNKLPIGLRKLREYQKSQEKVLKERGADLLMSGGTVDAAALTLKGQRTHSQE